MDCSGGASIRTLAREVALLATMCVAATCGGAEPASQAPPSGPLVPAEERRPAIVALGDGVTAGVGLLEAQTWPGQVQARLDENGYDLAVVNAGVPGDTAASALARVDDALRGEVVIVIVALGAEDVRRGVPVETLERSLAAIIERAHERRVAVLFTGTTAPPDFGPEYALRVARAYQDLARRYDLVFVPDLLEGVGGRRDLLQADGVHPNADGARTVSDRIWLALQPMVDTITGGALLLPGAPDDHA